MIRRVDEDPQWIDDSDIPWITIRGLSLEVVGYLPLAEGQAGTDLMGRRQVKDFSHRLPYALLEVECNLDPRPAQWRTDRAIFPVFHRLDFGGVEEAMRIAGDSQMVVVIHRPIKFPWYWPMKRAMPTMIVLVMPKDQSERREGEVIQDWAKRTFPVWTYEPLVSRFQGRWIYQDQAD
jgi:hypothetical protein